jgi:two-component sensor histidine kinase
MNKKSRSYLLVFALQLSCFMSFSQNTLKKAELFHEKAQYFEQMPQYDRDSSNFYYLKTLALLEKSDANNFEFLAKVYRTWGDYNTRHFSYSKLDSIALTGWNYIEKSKEKSLNEFFKYNYLVNWAKIKLEEGKLDTSIVLFKKALSKVEKVKDEEIAANVLMNKGWFYRRYNLKSEKELTLDNLYQSLKFYNSQGIKQYHLELFSIYKGLVGVYIKTNPDSTFYYLEKAKSVIKFNKNPLAYAWYYSCYGRELITEPEIEKEILSEDQIERGTKNILEALNILQTYQIKNTATEPYCYGLLGDIHLKRSQFDLALDYYKKSVEGYLAANHRHAAGAMLEFISDTYLQQGEVDSALIYYKEFFSESVNFEREKNQRSLRESELEINVLKRDKEIEQKESQALLYAVTLGIIVTILALLYRNFRTKQKTNKKLEAINADLANKNNLLDKRNAENELLLKEIHHRVKNNLEMVKSLIALQSAQIDDPATKDAMIASQNRVQSMGIIHQKLYQGTNLGSIEMKDYFLNLGEGILDTFNAEERVKIECAMDDLDLDVDTAVPIGLIVNELLTNALKYAFPKNEQGTIHISLEKSADNNLKLRIKDNGVGKVVGMAPKGTGFGTQLVQLLTQQLNGKMQEHTDEGTHIEFDFLIRKSA